VLVILKKESISCEFNGKSFEAQKYNEDLLIRKTSSIIEFFNKIPIENKTISKSSTYHKYFLKKA